MTNNLISIIIPVYNKASYIQKCFQSIEKLNSIIGEYIFVNDGSTDGSLEILESIAVTNCKVIIINQQNRGAASARNAGVRAAISKYILFLDADDWINAKELEKCLDIAEQNETEILGFFAQIVDKDNKNCGVSFRHPLKYNQLLDGKTVVLSGFQPSSACFYLYKTEFLKRNQLFFMEGINEEDVELTARMFLPAKKVIFVENIVYFYLKTENSVTNTKDEKRVRHYLNSVIVVAKSIMDHKSHILDKELKTAIEKNANSVVWNLIWRLCKQKEVDKEFRLKCVQQLKDKQLYPIKGPLKTKFQKVTSMFLNIPFLIKTII